MEGFWVKSPPKSNSSVKSEVEFDIKSESDYDIVENLCQPDYVTECELETEVQVKCEPEADVWIKCEPDVWIKKEPKPDTEIIMELEDDQETVLEIGSGTKLNNFVVRIITVCILFYFS